MIETAIYFSAGFLSAALLGCLLAPLIYRRAMRRAMNRIVSAAPYPTEEIRADKDDSRSRLATSTRQLEKSLSAMKAKTLSKLTELGQKTDMIAQLQRDVGEKVEAITSLKNELGEKAAAIFALEDRNRILGERLGAVQAQFDIRGNALRETEQVLAEKEAELIRLNAELRRHSINADRHREDISALRDEVEAIRLSVIDYENALNESVLRLAHDDEDDFNSLEWHDADRLGEQHRR